MKYREDLKMLGFTEGVFNSWDHETLPISLTVNKKNGHLKIYVIFDDYHSSLNESISIVSPGIRNNEPKIHKKITELKSIDELIQFLTLLK